MADQVEIVLPKTRVNEENAFPLTAYFRVRSTKASSVPTTVRYRIDCLKSGAEIKGWTTVSAAASVTITITADDNQIRNGSNRFERKQIIVQADNGLSGQVSGKAVWIVDNLTGIT